MAPDPAAAQEGFRARCVVEIEITVDVPSEYGPTNVEQAVQDEIGHTGAKVIDVIECEQVP